MSNFTDDNQLSRLEHLMNKGLFNDALHAVQDLEKSNNISKAFQLELLLRKSLLLVCLGRHEEGLDQAKTVFDREDIDSDSPQRLDAIIIMVEALWRLGRIDESQEMLLQAQRFLVELKRTPLSEVLREKEAAIHHHQGIIYWLKGDLDSGMKFLQNGLDLRIQIGDKQLIASSLNNLGSIHSQKGNLDQALRYYKESLVYFHQSGNKQQLAAVLHNLGNLNLDKGDLDEVLMYFQQSLEILEKIGPKQQITVVLNSIGLVYANKGFLNESLEFYQRGLSISGDTLTKKELAVLYSNIGQIYCDRGELNLALQYHFESLAFRKELGNKQDIASSLQSIGRIYRKKDDLNHAVELFEQSLALREEIGNNLEISTNLFNLFSTSIERNKFSDARKYYQRLELISKKEQNKIVQRRSQLAKAILLKRGCQIDQELDFTILIDWLTKLVEAKTILREIVNDKVTEYKVTTYSIYELCEILLLELKVLGKESALEEITDLSNFLLQIALEQEIHPLFIQASLLSSRIALIDLDIERARSLLAQARQACEKRGLLGLGRVIVREEERLLNQLNTWQELTKKENSIYERLEQARLEQLISLLNRDVVENLGESHVITSLKFQEFGSFMVELFSRNT
ncbi:MAG: tetratricopeptide repeat protein [Candidatus Odinarchaeota archaeon]